MARSLALGLYLLLAERGAGQAPEDRPARPDGPLLWLHAGLGSRGDSLRQLARLFADARPDLRLLVTGETGELPPGALADLLPDDRLPAVRSFLDHWRPDATLFIGASLPAALIAETHARHIPLLMADATLQGAAIPFWRRGLAGSVLARFERIMATDPESVSALRQLGGRSLNVELAGRIEQTFDPLPVNEAEREDIAERLRARPVWLVVNCPETEDRAVTEAHIHALSHAHRLLLILAPDSADRTDTLADLLAAEGLIAARRSHEEEVEPEVQVLITDGPTELGLWYRLAPVTYMGGTLSGQVAGRSPFEPAALGSAILHGPHTPPHDEAYRRLAEARATRALTGPQDLSTAVADLIAPDKAAQLAHNAWAASSGGADVAERLAQVVLAAIDRGGWAGGGGDAHAART
jgi:3-deoxy-D-manno-octulosonic-acid transferase